MRKRARRGNTFPPTVPRNEPLGNGLGIWTRRSLENSDSWVLCAGCLPQKQCPKALEGCMLRLLLGTAPISYRNKDWFLLPGCLPWREQQQHTSLLRRWRAARRHASLPQGAALGKQGQVKQGTARRHSIMSLLQIERDRFSGELKVGTLHMVLTSLFKPAWRISKTNLKAKPLHSRNVNASFLHRVLPCRGQIVSICHNLSTGSVKRKGTK